MDFFGLSVFFLHHCSESKKSNVMEFGGVCMSKYLNVYVQPALVHPALSYIVCFNKKKKLWTQTFMFERQKTRREEFIFNVSKNDWCFPKKFMSHDRVMFSFCLCA